MKTSKSIEAYLLGLGKPIQENKEFVPFVVDKLVELLDLTRRNWYNIIEENRDPDSGSAVYDYLSDWANDILRTEMGLDQEDAVDPAFCLADVLYIVANANRSSLIAQALEISMEHPSPVLR